MPGDRGRARRGEGPASGVLMLHGDAGVGKTALLEYARRSAGDMLVVGGAGCEAEVELGFAARHQLTRPVHDRIDRLPGPQARALRVAFGLESCGKRDRFLASVALLTLLGVAAADRPLLCAVDDAQALGRARRPTYAAHGFWQSADECHGRRDRSAARSHGRIA